MLFFISNSGCFSLNLDVLYFVAEPGYLGFDGEVAPPLIPFDIQAQCLSDPQG